MSVNSSIIRKKKRRIMTDPAFIQLYTYIICSTLRKPHSPLPLLNNLLNHHSPRLFEQTLSVSLFTRHLFSRSKQSSTKKYTAYIVCNQRYKAVYCLEQVAGIEPAWPAWKAGVLPLNYTCACYAAITFSAWQHS